LSHQQDSQGCQEGPAGKFPGGATKGLSVKQTEISIVPEGSTSEQIMMMSEVFTLLTFFLSTQEGT
jgi:hypothetical protein